MHEEISDNLFEDDIEEEDEQEVVNYEYIEFPTNVSMIRRQCNG